MDRFVFWQKWLTGACLILIVFGLMLAFLNQTALFDFLFNNQVNPVFFASADVSTEIAAFQWWIYGVLGATVAGWGIFMAFIALHPFKAKEKWAWNCLVVGLLAWFIIDTFISLYANVYFNAVFNTFLLILIGLPLVFTRKFFAESITGGTN